MRDFWAAFVCRKPEDKPLEKSCLSFKKAYGEFIKRSGHGLSWSKFHKISKQMGIPSNQMVKQKGSLGLIYYMHMIDDEVSDLSVSCPYNNFRKFSPRTSLLPLHNHQ